MKKQQINHDDHNKSKQVEASESKAHLLVLEFSPLLPSQLGELSDGDTRVLLLNHLSVFVQPDEVGRLSSLWLVLVLLLLLPFLARFLRHGFRLGFLQIEFLK